MSGFLRQLASRSLGLAPRMRSVAALQTPPARGGLAVEDAWLDAGPAAAAQPVNMQAPAPAEGLEALDRWARSQPGLAPQEQAAAQRARGPARDAPAAPSLDNATPPRLAPRQPSRAPFAADDHPPPRANMPRTDTRALQPRKTRPSTDGVQAVLRALQAQGVGEPAPMRPDASPEHADRGEHAENAAPQPSRPRPAPVSRPAPAHHAAPDVHITIDRLEVAPPAPAPRAAPPARTAALSLRAYLAARRTGLP